MSSETHQARVGIRSRRRIVGVLLALAMAAALAGCGDDSEDASSFGSRGADIVIDKVGFHPDSFEIKVGEEVNVEVLNEDDRDHTFTLTFLDIDVPIPAGQSATVKLRTDEVPAAGFYSFYSKDRQVDGYFGRIDVEG